MPTQSEPPIAPANPVRRQPPKMRPNKRFYSLQRDPTKVAEAREQADRIRELWAERGETCASMADRSTLSRTAVSGIINQRRAVKGLMALLAVCTDREIQAMGYWEEWKSRVPKERLPVADRATE